MTQSILLVDEDPATRFLLRLLLEDGGFRVHESDYGMDAFNWAKENQPDLMIFDVKQAQDAGFAVCKPEKDSQTAVLPIIMLKAQTKWNVFREILRDTTTQYLPKPFGGKELVACIQELLDNPLPPELSQKTIS